MKTHWQDTLPQETIDLLTKSLIAFGKTEDEASTIIEDFWNDAFSQGESNEAFNNCGEDA